MKPPTLITRNFARKTTAGAKLERLNPDQTKQLMTWLEVENRTYLDVAARVRSEFGLHVGKSSVGRFWQRHVRPKLELPRAAPTAVQWDDSRRFPSVSALN